jgi:hypothetical protein
MDHSTSLTQHILAPPAKVWSVITDIPGSAATRKALTRDLAEIEAKAELLR